MANGSYAEHDRTPGSKLLLAILIGLALSLPLFSVWLLVYDRQNQSEQAAASITEGWGGPQIISGPLLVIPYRAVSTETALENGKSVTRTREVMRELILSPEAIDVSTDVKPEVRKRSIYEAVVYDAKVAGKARFAFPGDLARHGVPLAAMDLTRAELRFGLSDPRGLGANPRVKIDGRALRLQPGGGSGGGSGFFAWVDATQLATRAMMIDFDYGFRGNASLSFIPDAGDTRWIMRSSWPHPSFTGKYLPDGHRVSEKGFDAVYRVGNLALGRSLVATTDPAAQNTATASPSAEPIPQPSTATVSLMQPVDLYSQVNRSTKYGFLFIGFTFLALLMFDIIGGVSVSAVEYLLMGAAIVLFFVLLLAFAEVIGFTLAYLVASAAIAGLNTAYSAAVLKSWRRAYFIGALLLGLYAVLYILLSLEAFSLLIGSLLLFAALAGVMYATRRIDWGGHKGPDTVGESVAVG